MFAIGQILIVSKKNSCIEQGMSLKQAKFSSGKMVEKMKFGHGNNKKVIFSVTMLLLHAPKFVPYNGQ